MEQKTFGNRLLSFENEILRSEFDDLFDTSSIVDKRRREQVENRVF